MCRSASLLEPLKATLTLHRLKVPEERRRSLRSTNLIENAVRAAIQRVKQWRKGAMRLRWSAAGLLAAGKRFRRVRGHKSMSVLVAGIDAYDAKLAAKEVAA